jgi:spore coat polysaccharide biosynthesis protein SpsF
MTRTAQLAAWAGRFGEDYAARNAASEEAVAIRTRAWAEMLRPLAADMPASILEVGCNVGINQRALKRLIDAEHWAIEPNAAARAIAVRDGALAPANLAAGDACNIPFPASAFDLVFTSGVLIHIAPENLERACREIHRVSKRYILCSEYFAREPEALAYRGREGLLFKRDFGSFWWDLFPDLEHVATGFFWRRTTGIDDVTWWLFRKPR